MDTLNLSSAKGTMWPICATTVSLSRSLDASDRQSVGNQTLGPACTQRHALSPERKHGQKWGSREQETTLKIPLFFSLRAVTRSRTRGVHWGTSLTFPQHCLLVLFNPLFPRVLTASAPLDDRGGDRSVSLMGPSAPLGDFIKGLE